MISISHWGMFEFRPWLFYIPAGFKLADDASTEWLKPDGIIEIVRS